MGYIISWLNKENAIMDIKAVSKLHQAKKFSMAKHKNARTIEIRQIRGNWKNAGQYILGIKLPNGNIDWQRVPSDSHQPMEGYDV